MADPQHYDLIRWLEKGVHRTGIPLSSPGNSAVRNLISWVVKVLNSSTVSHQHSEKTDVLFGVAFRELIEIVISKLSDPEPNKTD